MPYAVAKNTCLSCHEKTKVYFADGLSPKVGEVYRYNCPRCGHIVYFRPDAGTVIVSGDESIPDDATMAVKKEFHYVTNGLLFPFHAHCVQIPP